MVTRFKLEAFIQLRNETRRGNQFQHYFDTPTIEGINARFEEIKKKKPN